MPTKNEWTEPDITINGHELSFVEAMTVRCALENFAFFLSTDGLGEDETGQGIRNGYLKQIKHIRTYIFKALTEGKD